MVQFYSALHECGRRDANEDSMALHRCESRAGELCMAVVCDGMGGEEAGELASGYVVERLSVWFYDGLPEALRRGYSRERLRKSLQRALFTIHEELRRFGNENMIRCGTTMTLLLIVGRHYLLFQSGDSMAYGLRRNIRALVPRQGSARGVEQCIGIGRFVKPYMGGGVLGGRSAFLLASDGLCKKLDESDFISSLSPAHIKSREDAERALRGLARAALRRGETDNMSAIYLRCG